eukprot:TRINITY_DN8301_c0_g2_i1.p2 TRINITY_DN8301_c0_g2~~TRINITY_DN8301_c0_g2_i1.p2  ORF type:complete len:107 (-),score=8.14 TRINITY_DN8301_c0_g2_i1:633-953(-)
MERQRKMYGEHFKAKFKGRSCLLLFDYLVIFLFSGKLLFSLDDFDIGLLDELLHLIVSLLIQILEHVYSVLSVIFTGAAALKLILQISKGELRPKTGVFLLNQQPH